MTKETTRELIAAERRLADFSFIMEIIQRGRIRPAKYKHYIKMPLLLYEELRDNFIIDPAGYYIDESAFFEFKNDQAIVSFQNLYQCEDLHRKIDRYLVIKFAGSYPIERGGIFF